MIFGGKWDAPICESALEVPTPVGEPCMRCGEEIVEGEQGFMRMVVEPFGIVTSYSHQPIHVECDMVGIVGHLVGVCTCTGWDTTTREAARECERRFHDKYHRAGMAD